MLKLTNFVATSKQW